MGSSLSLLHTLFCLKRFSTHVLDHPKIKQSLKFVGHETMQNQIQKKHAYLGNEMFHDYKFHAHLEHMLTTQFISYYNHRITGFKEIRWDLFDNLNFLCTLNLLYKKVKYIYLTRADSDILQSSKKAWSVKNEDDLKRRIKHKQTKINEFLSTQPAETIIIGDVTNNSKFINEIYNFVGA